MCPNNNILSLPGHTEPLFERLMILDIFFLNCYAKNNFQKSLNILPTPLNDLFIINTTLYNYFTRQHNDLNVDIGYWVERKYLQVIYFP